MIDTYDNMNIIIFSKRCKVLNWQICNDLKEIAMLLGLQCGFTKYCFSNVSGATGVLLHIIIWENVSTWDCQYRYMVSIQVASQLADTQKVYLLPVHIKLGLMKNFIKAMEMMRKTFTFYATCSCTEWGHSESTCIYKTRNTNVMKNYEFEGELTPNR